MSKFLRPVLAATGLSAASGAAALAYAHYVELNAFRVHHIQLPVLRPGAGTLKVLHISDLHMLPEQRAKQAWVAGLSALKPDLVVNTGDNLGDSKAVPAVLRALDPLLHVPGIFCFGTNDYFGPRPVNWLKYLTGKKRKVSDEKLPWEGMRAAFIEHGWHDATHQRLNFKVAGVNVSVAGVDDPHHDLDDYDQVAGQPHPDTDLAIGLTHSPEPRVLDRFAEDGYNLVLAGHTHGGQVCLPGGKAIVTNCGIDRSRVAGVSRWTERTWLHVSNGLGTSKYAAIRFFCPPSATMLHLVEREAPQN